MLSNNNLIGNRIKSIRLNLGLSTEKFATLFNPPASKGTVSKWENGRYLPNNTRLKKIAELGNISVDELLYGKTNWSLYDKQFGDALKQSKQSVNKLETFLDYLKSLGYQVNISTSEDHNVGEVEIQKEDSKTTFDLNEFNKFQTHIEDTISFQLWKKQNYLN